MSLIYKSLQRVRTDNTPQSVKASFKKPRRNFSLGLSRRLAGFLVVCMVFSLAGFVFFSWVQREVERLEPRTHGSPSPMTIVSRQDEPVAAHATASNTTAVKVAEVLEKARERGQKELPPLSKPTKVRMETRKKLGMEDLVKPTTDLERHFASLARRNQAIAQLEKTLVRQWRGGQTSDAEATLEKMEDIAGAESVLVRKWKGMLALAQGMYDKAEDIFRELIRNGAGELSVRLNLVQCLVAQGRTEEARKALQSLKQDFPGNPRVVALEQRAF